MAVILSGQYYGRGGQTGELQVFGERPKALATSTCFHCSRVIFLKPNPDGSPVYGHCKLCDKIICAQCHAKGGCTPWEKQMEAMESRDRFRRALAAL